MSTSTILTLPELNSWRTRLDTATNGNTVLRQNASQAIQAYAQSISLTTPPPPPDDFPPYVKIVPYFYNSAYPYGMGVEWGTTVNRQFAGGNKINSNGEIVEMPIRVWRFTPPEGRWKGTIQINPGTRQVACIGHFPGDFYGVTNDEGNPVARFNGGNISTTWSTVEGQAGIVLTPGETYCLSIAHLDLRKFVENGEFIPTISCSRPPCPGGQILWAMMPMQPC